MKQKEKKRFSFLKHKVYNIITVIAVFLFLYVVALFFRPQLLPGFSSNTTIDHTVIEDSVRELSELVTLTYEYTDVGDFSHQETMDWFGKEIGIIGTSKSFIITFDGTMKLGLDMSIVSIDTTDKVLTFTLPPAQILSHTINENSIKVYHEESGLFTSFSVTDYTKFIAELKPEMAERARKRDLFSQAQLNAQTQIRTFVSSLPGIADEFDIRFVLNDAEADNEK